MHDGFTGDFGRCENSEPPVEIKQVYRYHYGFPLFAVIDMVYGFTFRTRYRKCHSIGKSAENLPVETQGGGSTVLCRVFEEIDAISELYETEEMASLAVLLCDR